MPRRPAHFKVFTSIQNHRHTLGVFDDDSLLAMYVRAGIMAIERYADRTGDSFLCTGRDLERVAGCRGVANARRKLGRLEASTRLTVGQEGAGYRLTIPNLAKKQFSRDGNGTETGPPSSSSSTSTTTSQEKTAATAAPFSLQGGNGRLKPEKKDRKRKKPDTPFPEPFPTEMKDALYRWGTEKGFSPPQVDLAIEKTADWAVGGGHQRANWVRCVQGYMRDGWALPKPGAPPNETDAERYARIAREFEEEERERAGG